MNLHRSSLKMSGTRGFTMLEMLVSLVILSVGLLGVAILQTKGQQFNHMSYLYTQANYLAYDIMDRMRANEPVALKGEYAQALPSELSIDCTKQTCSSSQMVSFDLYSWKTLLERTLPGGEGTIVSTSTSKSSENRPDIEIIHCDIVYEVSIKWLINQKDEQSIKKETLVLKGRSIKEKNASGNTEQCRGTCCP